MNFIDAKNISISEKPVKRITTPDGRLVWPFPKFIQWIKSSGTQYIDTGILPTLDYSVEVKAIKDTNYSLFGSGRYNYVCTGIGDRHFCYIGNGFLGWESGGISDRFFFSENITDEAHIWKISGKTGYCDENTTSQSTLTGTLTDNLYLFCRSDSTEYSTTGYSDAGSHTVYYCKVWDADGGLVRDFKPCIYRTEVGLWDLVEGKFYGNSGTGKFTAGPVE